MSFTRPRRLLPSLALLAALGPWSAPSSRAQEESAPSAGEDAEEGEEAPARIPFEAPHPPGADGLPIALEISRRPLPNFLVDELATIPHTSPDGLLRDFADAFMVGSNEARFAAVWDPRSCRLVGVLDLEAPPPPAPDADRGAESPEAPDEPGSEAEGSSPYLLRAAGPAPLLASPGGFGTPRYFGFRLVAGKPEFLYIFGGLLVEERIWFENGGEVLLQRFAVREPAADLVLTLPKEWAERCAASHGTWRENVLTVPQEEADSLLLAYRLAPAEEEAGETGEGGENPEESPEP